MSKKICLIPARKGSQRFKDKNLAKINEKTLVDITVEQAIAADIFDEIYVSSDHPLILKNALAFKEVTIHNRKKEDAGIADTLIKFIRSFIAEIGLDEDDSITLLLVTAPLRLSDDIHACYRIFQKNDNVGTVVSVVENEYPLELLWRIKDDHLEYISNSALSSTRKQDFNKSFKFNDAIVLDTCKSFMDPERNLFGKNPIPYIMPPERSIYIDYKWQFDLIKLIIENRN